MTRTRKSEISRARALSIKKNYSHGVTNDSAFFRPCILETNEQCRTTATKDFHAAPICSVDISITLMAGAARRPRRVRELPRHADEARREAATMMTRGAHLDQTHRSDYCALHETAMLRFKTKQIQAASADDRPTSRKRAATAIPARQLRPTNPSIDSAILSVLNARWRYLPPRITREWR